MTAVDPSAAPVEIGAQMWGSVIRDLVDPAVAIAWVSQILRHATRGRPDLALKTATTGPTTNPKET